MDILLWKAIFSPSQVDKNNFVWKGRQVLSYFTFRIIVCSWTEYKASSTPRAIWTIQHFFFVGSFIFLIIHFTIKNRLFHRNFSILLERDIVMTSDENNAGKSAKIPKL